MCQSSMFPLSNICTQQQNVQSSVPTVQTSYYTEPIVQEPITPQMKRPGYEAEGEKSDLMSWPLDDVQQPVMTGPASSMHTVQPKHQFDEIEQSEDKEILRELSG